MAGQRLAGAGLRPGNGPDGLLGVRVLAVQVAAAVMPEGEESAALHPGATLLALISAVRVAPCIMDWKVLHEISGLKQVRQFLADPPNALPELPFRALLSWRWQPPSG
mmetsp:Transcript_46129/g.142706  ORF Transcript_46129/g.142706 Transcript_46129/m.142706 type:complete len:108 (-) Transcript_46129:367-690(-)